MKVFLIGGVGAMGFGTASDLVKGDLLSELVLADVDSYRIDQCLESLRDSRVKGIKINAKDYDYYIKSLEKKGFVFRVRKHSVD